MFCAWQRGCPRRLRQQRFGHPGCRGGPSFSIFVLELPHVTLIELRLALISYQDYHMLLLALAGHKGRGGGGAGAGGDLPRGRGHGPRLPGESSYPQNHAGRGWGIRNGAMGAVRLPKILVLTIDGFVSAQHLPGAQSQLFSAVLAAT